MKCFLIAITALVAAIPALAEVRALVIDPPSNIRTSPNGAVICQVPEKTYINILGTSPDGTWYKTDYCGRLGYIHQSQITQPENFPASDSGISGYCILRGVPFPTIIAGN